ncbi:MAG: hypothetical protein LBI11_07150 [Streptococcaceae bacterium]|jgi:L-threonylcarbamoyladenylate synthase|nr:hypothetical protein [Streptococcaceae bacterium]
MKIDMELRAMSQTLSQEFALVRRMANEGEVALAREEFNFAKEMLVRFIDKVRATDGQKLGVAGKVFRHPYYVPDDYKQLIIALGKESKKIEHLLAKKESKGS